MRLSTWQQARIQIDGKQQWAESSLFDRRVKMSTSRKLMVKLDTHPRHSPKHRHAARKATSTEAAQDNPEPKQKKLSTALTPAMTQRRTVTARSALTVTQFVCFCHWLWGRP